MNASVPFLRAVQWPTWLQFVAPFVAGAVSALGFEPLAFWPLTLAGFLWLFHVVGNAGRPQHAFGLAWRFAVGHFIVGLNWIAAAFTYQAAMPAWLGIPAVILLSLYLGLFPGLAAVTAWHVSGRGTRERGAGFVLVFAGAWVICEYLRATLLTGFAWNPLGVVLLPILPLAQAASWMGSYGLSALVLLLAGVAWLAVKKKPTEALALAVIAAIAPLIAWVADRPESSPAADVPVRIVQPNIHQDEKHAPEMAAKHARIYMELSGPPGPRPRILLWPEAATLHFLELEPEAREEIATLLGPRDTLVLGGSAVVIDPRERVKDVYYNSVFALDSGARVLWRYDKAHLVPFGEYLPLRPLLESIGLAKLTPGDGDFSGGPGPGTFQVPGFGTIGMQICYEIIFSGRVVDEKNRPAFLFNPSNDAWFGSWGPSQHFAQARLRAIEEGIAVVRATPTGVTGVIAPDGTIVSTLPPHTPGVLDALVPPKHAPTLFARWGVWMNWLVAAVLTGAGFIGASLRRSAAP